MSTDNQYVLLLACPDKPGIVHAVSGFLLRHGGNIVDSMQYGDSVTGTFCMRVQFSAMATTRALRDRADVPCLDAKPPGRKARCPTRR